MSLPGPSAFSFGASATAPGLVKEGGRWWSPIEILVSDSMEGRNTGSPGHVRAASSLTGPLFAPVFGSTLPCVGFPPKNVLRKIPAGAISRAESAARARAAHAARKAMSNRTLDRN
jgi:hypothetical protein